MLLLHGSMLMKRKTQLIKNLIYHLRVNKGRFQPQLIITHLGRPIASSKCGTVQLSSMMWPEMSRDTRCTRRWTIAVRIFLVILNFEIRLLSWEMSRCLKEEGVSSVTIFQMISGHTRGATHVLKWQHANCSKHSVYHSFFPKSTSGVKHSSGSIMLHGCFAASGTATMKTDNLQILQL